MNICLLIRLIGNILITDEWDITEGIFAKEKASPKVLKGLVFFICSIDYLRSKISQERLNGLAILCIVKDVIEHIDVDTIISDFAYRNCNALVVFIYFIKYRVYLIELFYLCDLLMFI